jgi:hypothetical protein
MHISRPARTLSLATVAGSAPLLLALSLQGRPALPPPTSAETPQQVADTLDSIVQPRFQQNAGRFGVDRIAFAGHDNIYGLSGVTASEKRRFRRVNAAHRPYVIAFLHCAHKPGRDLLSKTRDKEEAPIPSLQTLAAATATDTGSQKLWDWSDTHLEKAVLPDLPVLRQGTGMDRDLGNWRLVLRPVRASRDSCLGCHAGARRGDTLGVMVYAVDKAVLHAPIQSFNAGDL